MDSFLICTNPSCRFVVNLREGAQVLHRSELIIEECPECGHPWSSHCPFCGLPLEAIRGDDFSRCSNCNREFRPDANADPAAH
jgi:transcription elongation factor Elf1